MGIEIIETICSPQEMCWGGFPWLSRSEGPGSDCCHWSRMKSYYCSRSKTAADSFLWFALWICASQAWNIAKRSKKEQNRVSRQRRQWILFLSEPKRKKGRSLCSLNVTVGMGQQAAYKQATLHYNHADRTLPSTHELSSSFELHRVCIADVVTVTLVLQVQVSAMSISIRASGHSFIRYGHSWHSTRW
jgi:hypothetical protein